MSDAVLVLIEPEEGRIGLVSRQALTLARELGSQVHALVLGTGEEAVLADAADYGVAVVHEPDDAELGAYAAAAWASVLQSCARATGAGTVLAGGTPRGTEVLAHLAARAEVPMAANVVQLTSTQPLEVERQVAGGAVLERMRLEASPAVLTVAGHAVEAEPAPTPGEASQRRFTTGINADDLRAQVVRTGAGPGGDSTGLAAARVVVGVGRGAGGAEGFEE